MYRAVLISFGGPCPPQSNVRSYSPRRLGQNRLPLARSIEGFNKAAEGRKPLATLPIRYIRAAIV